MILQPVVLTSKGFASGNLDKDAQSVRMFVADGGELLMAQSYAKNMGLYGERVGALSIVCGSADVAVRVESQLKLVIRPMYSNPPLHGASTVATILKDSEMFNEWTVELKAMADRIISLRQQLFDALKTRGTPGDWSHIIKSRFSGSADHQAYSPCNNSPRMFAELQMLTPMVPTRELYFLRHCKKLATDKWAIVDGQVLEESLRAHHRRADQRPLQGDLGRAHHMPQCHGPVDVLDGNCERTGVRREALDGGASAAVREDGLLGGDQHSEKGLEWCLHTGRQKERPEGRAPDDVEPVSRHRQIAGPGMEQGIADAGNNVHITSGKNTGDPGELEGMIACAVNPTALSDFLRDETRRCKWDVTLPGSGRSVQSFVNLAKGKHRGNCVTAYAATEQNGEWILQDSSTNAYESTVAYAPIDAAIL